MLKPINIENVNLKINRSKVNYAITLAKSLVKKDPQSIEKIWVLCGFNSKRSFEVNFKKVYGKSFHEYIETL